MTEVSINERTGESLVGGHSILCDGPAETVHDPKERGAWMCGGKQCISNSLTYWTLSLVERLKEFLVSKKRQMVFP